MAWIRGLVWLAVAGLGALAYGVMAFRRGETLNSAYLVLAALCTYGVAILAFMALDRARASVAAGAGSEVTAG